MEKQVEKKIIRMFGTDLDGSLRVARSLMKIKGISFAFAQAVRRALNIPPDKKLQELSEEELKKVEECIKNPEKFGIPSFLYNRRKDRETGKDMHLVSGDLEIAKKLDIEFLKSIKCYRGIRHMYGFKLRGQRTKSRGASFFGRVGPIVGVSKKKAKKGGK
ncbi:30S ribosomal protein S13 [Nanoarchaeota archaeon]|nr:MAG: 30S ribosomal protein S13 [Nanoarchaeota archaeon]